MLLRELFEMPRCVVCGREPDSVEDKLLCNSCRKRFAYEEKHRCSVCGQAYRACHCKPQFASPYIENYMRYSYYREERVVGRMALAAKDREDRHLNRFMAQRLAEVVTKRGITADVIVFVPCADESFVRAGYDHGGLLAKALGKQLSLPIADCFHRRRGSAQKKLGAAERLANSKSSLLPRTNAADLVRGKRVLLLDDIMTTGASALVASVHLHEMGAKTIDFVCFGSR